MLPILTNQACDEGAFCKNSKQNAPYAPRCIFCRWSPETDGKGSDQWRPIDGKRKHPEKELTRRQAAKERIQQARQQRLNKDKRRRTVLRKAEHAEKQTTSSLVKATKNSGRINRDGDHKVADIITLDTKHQSQRDNPLVNLSELSKVRKDARNAGSLLGGLVLRNKHGVAVVVFSEEDFAKLAALIKQETGVDHEQE